MRKVALGAAAGLAFVLMGFTVEDARRALDGQWRSAGLVLTIKADAGEATLADAARPVERERFELKKVVGNTVLFTVGDKRLVGLLAEDRLTITIGNDPFSQVLRRSKPIEIERPGRPADGPQTRGRAVVSVESGPGGRYRVLTIRP